MNIRPLFDRVLISRSQQQDQTESGLFLPQNSKEKPAEGIIIAVGNGRVLNDGSIRALTVKEGDKVVFEKYSGTEIKIDGEDRLIMREDDILGVID